MNLTMNHPPQPHDFLTLGYIALSVGGGNAFKLFNVYTHSADCRLIGIRFDPTDNSWRVVHQNGHRSEALCYVPYPRGTVVPQTIWQPAQAGDVQRHVVEANLLWPIFFVRTDNVVGINMAQILNNGPVNLRNANALVPMGGLASTHLCVKWPGYPDYRKQVEIKNNQHQPITMSRLAERIARFVERFIQESASQHVSGYWRVGPGAINKDNICIIGLVHVSKGVWQPILQLNGLNFN